MEARPHRFWAFVLALVAAVVLVLPVVYTAHVHDTFGPWGSLVAWTSASVAIFGILTILVSVVRAFVAPAIRTEVRRRRKRKA